MLVREMEPVNPLATDVGAKSAVKDVACPGVSVRGVVSPVTLKPVPLAVAAVIVTFELPVLVTETARASVDPTVTSPKSMLEGLTVNCSNCAWPVPVRATAVGELEALLTSDTLPAATPEALGAN